MDHYYYYYYYYHHRRWHDAYSCVTRASSFVLSRQKDESIANKALERCARSSIDPRWFTRTIKLFDRVFNRIAILEIVFSSLLFLCFHTNIFLKHFPCPSFPLICDKITEHGWREKRKVRSMFFLLNRLKSSDRVSFRPSWERNSKKKRKIDDF